MRYLLAFFLLLASTAASFAAPNIVVIMTDDQATSSLAYMPKLQKLIAEQGITFDNSFVNLSLCAPSRASFMTGEAAHNHGIKANSPLDQGGWESFKDKEPDALPVWLQRAGYDTALVGKYLNRYGQQDTFGALLGWAGNTFGIDVQGSEDRQSARLGAAGLGSLVRLHRVARQIFRLRDQRERRHPRFRLTPRRLFHRRACGARGALHRGPAGDGEAVLYVCRDEGRPRPRRPRHPGAEIRDRLRRCPAPRPGAPSTNAASPTKP